MPFQYFGKMKNAKRGTALLDCTVLHAVHLCATVCVRVGMAAYSGQTRELVVHHGGHVELQQLHVLSYDVGRGATLFVPPQLVVDLDDVSQLVSQVILKNCEIAA